MRAIAFLAVGLFGLLRVALAAGDPSNSTGDSSGQGSRTSRPSVVVATVTQRDVSKQKVYVGRVQAIKTVQITARVEGWLEQRDFKEGGFVKKDQLLFVIEQTSYKAAVEQSEADVEANQAQLKNDQLDYDRNKSLAATKDVTQETLDSSKSTLDVSNANVKKSKAALETSNLNLSYTEIHSPIDGRISAANVDVGNLVSPSTGTLATIVSMDPIYVTFYVSNRDLLAARKAGVVKGAKSPLTPYLTLSDGSAYAHPGKLNYLGVQVDQSTDTIEVRAEFPNPDYVLIPGQFVNVTVMSDKKRSAAVVPQVSVQQDQSGYYVLVVGKDEKVARRNIELGQQVETDWVVTKGLAKGEKVIVEGIQKVVPGTLVSAVDQKA
jgi:membrane fusion protein, multidrug efflux system